jgi:hypothetical protein
MDDDHWHLWQEWWQSHITELRLEREESHWQSMELRALAAQLRAESQALRRNMRSHSSNQVGTPGSAGLMARPQRRTKAAGCSFGQTDVSKVS